jgi:transposase
MKYTALSDNSLLYGKNQFIYRTEETDKRIDIFLKSAAHSCKCPCCGMESSDLHATYQRTLQDVPIRCKTTYVHANIFNWTVKYLF